MKRKISIDKKRAFSLQLMSKTTLERLNSFDKLKYPSNTLDDYYNILHNLMEAISLLDGIKFSGDSAHKELIEWITIKMNFPLPKKIFLQNIRNLRNKISYEGFFIKTDFIKNNDKNIMMIIKELNKTIDSLK